MKLLQQFELDYDAEELSQRLKNNGIATKISGNYSNHYRLVTGGFSISLWVILDEQFEDALALIKDPNYKVKYKLSNEEIHQLETLPTRAISKLLNNLANVLASIATAILLSFIFYSFISQ